MTSPPTEPQADPKPGFELRYDTAGAAIGLLGTIALQLEYGGLDEGWWWVLGLLMGLLGGVLGFAIASSRRRRAAPIPTPWPALALVFVLVAAFAAQLAAGGMSGEFVGRHVHLLRVGALAPELVRGGQVWRIGAATLLHGGTLHLLLDGLAVFMLAGALARRAPPILVFGAYFLPALASGALVAAVVPGGLAVLSTAGGAGLFGAALVAERLARQAGAPANAGWLWWGVVGTALAAAALTPHTHGGAQVLAGGFGAALVLWDRRLRPLAGARSRAHPAIASLGVAAVGLSGVSGALAARHAATATATAHAHELRVITAQLTDATALNSAAWDIAVDPDAGRAQLELAKGLSARTVELDPKRAPYLDTLATLKYRLGHPAEAARIELGAAARGVSPFFWSQLQRFLRAHKNETGEILQGGGLSSKSIHFERVGWGIVFWWRRGTAPTVVAEVHGEDEARLGTVLLVATGTTSGSNRYSIPDELAEHLDAGAQLAPTWVRAAHPDWSPGLRYFSYDPQPDTLP